MKKGFTLVELLAVIVVLAIISIIAIPQVLSVIDKSKINSFKESANGLISAIEIYYTPHAGIEMTLDLSDPQVMEAIEFKGTYPQSGEVYITKEGLISIKMYDGKYCAYKKLNDKDISVEKGNCNNISIVENSGGVAKVYISAAAPTNVKNFKINGNTANSKNLANSGTLKIVVTGKNLFNYKWFNSTVTNQGMNVKNNYNGSFTISGSNNTTASSSFSLGNYNISASSMKSKLVGAGGSYTISLKACENTTSLPNNYSPYFYLNHYHNGSDNSDRFSISTMRNGNYMTFNFIDSNVQASDFRGSFGFYVVQNQLLTNATVCPQFEYGTSSTSFEPYKEKIYNITLKNNSGTTINGIALNETLEKKNGIWQISSSNTTILHISTQQQLNNILLFEGINNVYIDDSNVYPKKLEIEYYK